MFKLHAFQSCSSVASPMRRGSTTSRRTVGLVDSPGGPNRFGKSAPPLLKFRHVARHPSKDRRIGDPNASLSHHLHQIPIREPIRNVPPYAELDNVGIEGPLAVHRVTSDRLRHPAPLI